MSRASASRFVRSAAAPSAWSKSSARPTAPGSPAHASIRRRRPSASSSATSRRCVQFVRDFSERQSQLFFLDQHVPRRLRAAGASPAHRRRRRGGGGGAGGDIRNRLARRHLRASSGLAARGAADRRAEAVLLEAGRGAGSAFERDAAVVLRRVEESVRRGPRPASRTTAARSSICSGGSSGNRRDRDGSADRAAAPEAAPQRLIRPVIAGYTWGLSSSVASGSGSRSA